MRDIKLYIMLNMNYKMIFIKLEDKSWKFKEGKEKDIEKIKTKSKSHKMIKKLAKYCSIIVPPLFPSYIVFQIRNMNRKYS